MRETSGRGINRASSESKQEGKKEKMESTSAFEIHLGCGRALEGCLFILRTSGSGKWMCCAIGVPRSVDDEVTGSEKMQWVSKGSRLVLIFDYLFFFPLHLPKCFEIIHNHLGRRLAVKPASGV